jgi:hypothetical protein
MAVWLGFCSMPGLWKFGMAVLILCLVASMAIAIVRLTTTPTEILGDGFHGLPPAKSERNRAAAAPFLRNAGIRNSGTSQR